MERRLSSLLDWWVFSAAARRLNSLRYTFRRVKLSPQSFDFQLQVFVSKIVNVWREPLFPGVVQIESPDGFVLLQDIHPGELLVVDSIKASIDSPHHQELDPCICLPDEFVD